MSYFKGISAISVTLMLGSCAFEMEHEDLSDEEIGDLFEEAHESAGKGDSSCSGVTPPDSGSFGKKVALTFDDGPNAATTPQIMEILRRHNAPATFFINGSRVTGTTEQNILEDMVDDPLFLVANHTWSHPQMTSLSSSSAASQIDRNTTVIAAAGETAKFFRFPYGAASCSLVSTVKGRGYAVTGWHIDSADWCYASGGGYCKASTFQYVPTSYRGDLKGYVLSQLGTRQGGIILFHDIHSNTANNLEAILTAIEAQGYRFVALNDATTFPLLNGKTPGFIGDRCSTSSDCGYSTYCHSAGFCSKSCAGYCSDLAGKAPTFCTDDPSTSGADGICVSKSSSLNAYCASVVGTESRSVSRYVGSSGAPSATATACVPESSGNPPVTVGFIGDACTSDSQCAFTSGGFCHPAGFCSLSCAGYCPDQSGKAGTFCTTDPTGEVAGGMCVSKSQSINSYCSAVPGTRAQSTSRYRGSSGAPAATATACVPE